LETRLCDPRNRLRVLHLAEGVGFRHGGPGIDIPNYCQAMAALGAEITLCVAWNDELDRPDCVLGRTVWGYPNDGKFQVLGFRAMAPKRWRLAPRLLPWLWRRIGGFDVVHLHSLYSFPVFQGALFSAAFGKPFVISTHGVLAPVQRRVSRKLKAVYGALLLRPLLPRAAAMVFSSKQERIEAGGLVSRLSGEVIPYGIALDRYDSLPPRGRFRAQYLDGWSGPLILYLGRLNAKKGIDVLIPAFQRLISDGLDARLAICGFADPPSYFGNLARLIQDLQIADKVILTGEVNENDKLSAFSDADLFVLPSRSENFGSAMFEAMACRLPVIVSTGVDLHSEVSQSGAGLVVALDPDALAAAMTRMIENVALRNSASSAARSLALQYSNGRTAERLLALYASLLKEDGIRSHSASN
jgi:glycosyltransferase involved in cell wall biosynthesis